VPPEWDEARRKGTNPAEKTAKASFKEHKFSKSIK
jgi:hypothetical protein